MFDAQAANATGRSLHIASFGLLALVFVSGGGSMDRGWGDAAAQLLALPVLLLAAITLGRTRGTCYLLVLLSLALFGPIVIGLQLAFGTTSTPWATERALYDWLPPAAAFLGCAALPASAQRQGLGLLIVLVAGSLLLAVLQLTAPQDSIVNPFPDWQPNFNGLFANQNHQATAFAVAAILLLTWPAQATSPTSSTAGRIGLAGLFLAGMALTNSRGMALIAAAALLVLPLANGWMGRQIRSEGGTWRVVAAVAAQVTGFAVVMASTLGWMQVDHLEEIRGILRDVTAELAWNAMPFGSGAGSYVPWMDAHLPDALLQPYYYNHAHNEYVQWWLEGGVLGLGGIFLLLAGFCWARPRRVSRAPRAEGTWVGAWLGIGCVLAHSIVDYPLRTPALATATAWLAAVAVSCAIDYRRQRRSQATATSSSPT